MWMQLIALIFCLRSTSSRKFDPLEYLWSGYLNTVVADWKLSHKGCIENGYENIGWFQCPSGRCIPWRRACDKIDDCGDGYDESNYSFCPEAGCKGNNLTCDVQTGVPQCLSEPAICDGKVECQDYADENRDTCAVECSNEEFPCRNGRCIPLSLICDQKDDCGDSSDEEVPGICEDFSLNGHCHHSCEDGKCVPWCCVCDGINDCPDGSDEKDCKVEKCAADEIPCSCLPLRLKCDKMTDCGTFQDEDPNECQASCINGTCSPSCKQDEFLCSNGVLCIPGTLVCDGKAHCSDGSDETRKACAKQDVLDFRRQTIQRLETSSSGCVTKDGRSGNCVAIQQCPKALELAAQGIYPQLCPEAGSTPLSVCCAVEPGNLKDSLMTTSLEDFAAVCGIVDREIENPISRPDTNRKCLKSPHPMLPGKTLSWCRQTSGVLPVGGINVTSATHYPWMVTLGLMEKGKYVNKCGGTLITDRHVLTAAHCFVDSTIVIARLSELNLDVPDEVTHVDRRIKSIHRHPQFQLPLVYNDIAILQLSAPVMLSRFIRPACLPTGALPPPDTWGATIGFGDTSFGGTPTPNLQYINVPILDQRRCEAAYAKAHSLIKRRYPAGIKDTMFCAGLDYGGRDSCQGDSGSGFVIPQYLSRAPKSVWGVVSFGLGCGSSLYPGIYTSVVHYLPWIKQIVEAQQ